MYFKSRVQAGQQLAELLSKYRYENTAIIALGDGGVVVGAQIAMRLHCVLTMLLSEELELPGENDPLAMMNQYGIVTYNRKFSEGEIDELTQEYYQFLEQKKLEKLNKIHRLLGQGGIIRGDLLRGHNVIIVSDGLNSGFPLDIVADFLKPLKLEKLIIATPIANITAVDKMHLVGDEIYCLDVVENYINTQHYYEENRLPDHETVIKTIQNIVLNWH